jgi:hypothetical protein
MKNLVNNPRIIFIFLGIAAAILVAYLLINGRSTPPQPETPPLAPSPAAVFTPWQETLAVKPSQATDFSQLTITSSDPSSPAAPPVPLTSLPEPSLTSLPQLTAHYSLSPTKTNLLGRFDLRPIQPADSLFLAFHDDRPDVEGWWNDELGAYLYCALDQDLERCSLLIDDATSGTSYDGGVTSQALSRPQLISLARQTIVDLVSPELPLEVIADTFTLRGGTFMTLSGSYLYQDAPLRLGKNYWFTITLDVYGHLMGLDFYNQQPSLVVGQDCPLDSVDQLKADILAGSAVIDFVNYGDADNANHFDLRQITSLALDDAYLSLVDPDREGRFIPFYNLAGHFTTASGQTFFGTLATPASDKCF